MSNVGVDTAQCPVLLPETKRSQKLSKTRKIRYYIFEILPNFTVSLYFVPNILSRIVDKYIKFFNIANTIKGQLRVTIPQLLST